MTIDQPVRDEAAQAAFVSILARADVSLPYSVCAEVASACVAAAYPLIWRAAIDAACSAISNAPGEPSDDSDEGVESYAEGRGDALDAVCVLRHEPVPTP